MTANTPLCSTVAQSIPNLADCRILLRMAKEQHAKSLLLGADALSDPSHDLIEAMAFLSDGRRLCQAQRLRPRPAIVLDDGTGAACVPTCAMAPGQKVIDTARRFRQIRYLSASMQLHPI
jgi:hypothetical protein